MAPETESPDAVLRADSRRNVLKGAVAGLAAGLFAASRPAHGQDPATEGAPDIAVPAFASTHELKPLSFESSSLKGLSTRLIESHWSNNYGGSVRALNETNRRLAAALADPDLPAFTYNDLKREHLMRSGSVVLHELYFDNLGGDGNPSADLRGLIGRPSAATTGGKRSIDASPPASEVARGGSCWGTTGSSTPSRTTGWRITCTSRQPRRRCS